MDFALYNPVKVHFKTGSLVRKVRDLVGRRPCVLIHYRKFQHSDKAAELRDALGDRLLFVGPGVKSNPDIVDLRQQYASFWEKIGDHRPVIVAVGGGSVIDTAKVLRHAWNDARGDFSRVMDVLEQRRPPEADLELPLIAVPTTAGTGSDVSPYATVWDKEGGRKFSFFGRKNWATHAVIDPELTYGLPKEVTISTGLDAVSHALESIWNRNAQPTTELLAVAAARTILDVLPRLVENLADRELRAQMSLASMWAGLAISQTATALAHSISYKFTLTQGLPHGIACSFSLPVVMRIALGRDPECDAVLKRVFGDELQSAPERLDAFLRGLGVATDFGSYGISKEEGRRMIENAMSGERGKNFIGQI